MPSPVTLSVDMDCRGYQRKIHRAIRYMDGVNEVLCLGNGRVVVTGNPDAAAVRMRLESMLRTRVTIMSGSPANLPAASRIPETTPPQPYSQPPDHLRVPPYPPAVKYGDNGLPQEGFYSGHGGSAWDLPIEDLYLGPGEITWVQPQEGFNGAVLGIPVHPRWPGGVPESPTETGEYQHMPNAPAEIFNDDNANGCSIQS